MVYTIERDRVSRNNNRAKKKKIEGTLTIGEWFQILHLYKFKCAICKKAPVETMEHLTPLRYGGGTTRYNCVPACQECNSQRDVVYLQTEQHQRRLRETMD